MKFLAFLLFAFVAFGATKDTPWRTLPLIVEPWYWKGYRLTESDYIFIATVLNTNGLIQYGWDTVGITDGWQGVRDANGNPQADATRFPHGLAFTVNVLLTNGLHPYIYTQSQATTAAGGFGSYGHVSQDASNYVAIGLQGVRYDFSDDLQPNVDLRMADACNSMAYALSNYAGKALPICSRGWTSIPGQTMMVPTSVQAWENADKGDIGVPRPTFFWTNVLDHFYYAAQFAGQGGLSHWAGIDSMALDLGYGIPSMWAIMPAFPWIARPPLPTEKGRVNSPFLVVTNQLWLSVIRDPLGLPGTMISSNVYGSVWVRQLQGNKKAVCCINHSTKAVNILGFVAADLGFNLMDLVDAWYFTNAVGLTANSVSVGPNTAALFIASPSKLALRIGFDSAQPLSTRGANLVIEASPGLNGRIQASTNLSHWVTLTNFPGSNLPLKFLDPGALTETRRFYRAVIP